MKLETVSVLFIIFGFYIGLVHTEDSNEVIICEHGTKWFGCGCMNRIINVLSANYGRTQPGEVHCNNNQIKDLNCINDVQENIARKCNGSNFCRITSGNAYGDICGGTYKYMNITYECIESHNQGSFKVAVSKNREHTEHFRCDCLNIELKIVVPPNYSPFLSRISGTGNVCANQCCANEGHTKVTEMCDGYKNGNITAGDNDYYVENGKRCNNNNNNNNNMNYECILHDEDDDVTDGNTLTSAKTTSTSVWSTTADVKTAKTTSDVTIAKTTSTRSTSEVTTAKTMSNLFTSYVTTAKTVVTSFQSTTSDVTNVKTVSMLDVTTGGMRSKPTQTKTNVEPKAIKEVTIEEIKGSPSTRPKTTELNSIRGLTTTDTGYWHDMQSFVTWNRNKESLILQKLRLSTNNSIIMKSQLYYSKATWVGKMTDVRQQIDFSIDGLISASVQVPFDKNDISVVFTYTTINNTDMLLTDGTSFGDASNCQNFANITTEMISDILSISVYEDSETIDAHVQHILPHTQKSLEYEENYVCSFYDTISRKWSNIGCEILSVTLEAVTCSCSHLTSFAILMQVSSNELSTKDATINSWITTIGLILSIVTLILNLLIYIILKAYGMSIRHKIHINFVVCILLFDIIFMTAIDNNGNKSFCKFVAVLLHYLILCMFMWMLAEGFLLVLKVVKNNANKYKMKHYMLTCYLIPICIVAMVAAISHDCYVTQKPCWLRNSCRVAVVLPGFLVIAVNLVVLCQMIYVIYTRSGSMVTKPQKIQKEYKQLRNAVRGSFVLFPILGVTWILGVFVIDTSVVFMVYLYTILNSLQGVFVFMVFCFMDNEVKEAGTKWINKYIRRRNTQIHDQAMAGQQGQSNPSAPTNQGARPSTATTNM